MTIGRGDPMWGVGLESRGVCSPCSCAAGHQVELLSAKCRRRWPRPSAREPDHSPGPRRGRGWALREGFSEQHDV